MYKLMLVAGLGGFAGTCARYAVSRWSAATFTTAPWSGTLLVNLAGCLVMGILWGLVDRARLASPTLTALMITGFCGGFTTFSTFANDFWTMANKGEWLTSALYLGASVIGGILLLFLGRALCN